MNDNYYKDLWTKPDSYGYKFWNRVNFNDKKYKLQEDVFRKFLKNMRILLQFNKNKPIETVLELGAGSGRMTKIILEELSDIKEYEIIDINPQLSNEIMNDNRIKVYDMDLTEFSGNAEVNGFTIGRKTYDLIVAVEVFMHIKPYLTMGGYVSKEIDAVMRNYCGLLAPSSSYIINIDWAFQPQHSDWCFIHDYDKLYRENGLHPVFEAVIPEIRQKLFCYGK